MQQLSDYLNSQLSKQEDERTTTQLLNIHYDITIKKKWEKILDEKYDVAPPITTKKHVRIRRIWKIGVAAASILLLVFVGKFYTDSSRQISSKKDVQQLLNTYLAQKVDLPNLKKSLEEKDEIRTKATASYTIGDYQKAIAYYNQIPDLQPEDNFFLGLSFLYNDQAEKAIPLFQKAIDLVPFNSFRVSEEIRWQLSLAFLKNGQFDKAKIELISLANNKSGKRQKDANIMLEAL